MASRSLQSKGRTLRQLRGGGTILAAAGLGFLVAPLLFGRSSPLRPVAIGLNQAAWPLITVGALLLVLYFFLSRRAMNQGGNLERSEPTMETRPADERVWSQNVFSDIEWRRFEAVCEGLFRQSGYRTETQSHGADGGVDIWLKHQDQETAVAIVQCKHWLRKPVGVKEVREFFGVMASKQVKRGAFATSGRFTSDALAFARETGIDALDGSALLQRILQRPQQQQQELLAVAYEGEYWKPTCASCGIKMVQRTSSRDNKKFWGCKNYPRCKSMIHSIPATD